jgi:long-chain acyl-CoA synthetase
MTANRTVNLASAFVQTADRHGVVQRNADAGSEKVLDITRLVARLRKQDSIILTVEGGRAVTRTHGQLHSDVQAACITLRDWGVRAGMRIGIRAPNCYRWIVFDLALIELRAVSVAFTDDFQHDALEDLIKRYQLSLMLIAGNERSPHYDALPAIAYIDVIKPGVRALDQGLRIVDAAFSHPWMTFSSGSSGGVKGLLLNRGGVESNVDLLVRQAVIRHDDRLLLFLPISNFQQRAMYYAALWFGFDLIVTEPARMFHALKEFRPTILIAPPTLYELFESRVLNAAPRNSWAVPLLGRALRLFPLGVSRRKLAGRLFNSVYDALGGNIRLMVTGMAPIKQSTLNIFAAMQLPLFEIYGLTEAGSIAINLPGAHRIGSVGRPLPGIDVKLAKDGEIIVRSRPPFADGYFECSAGEGERTFIGDEWVATGDIGRFDRDGYLYVVGRKKEIIVMSNGKKVHPEAVEADIDACTDVAKSVVFGRPGVPFLTAVVTTRSPGDIEARRRIEMHIDSWSQRRPAFAVGKVVFSETPFTRENGFLRPNLKLDRKRICQHFGGELTEFSPASVRNGMPSNQNFDDQVLALIAQATPSRFKKPVTVDLHLQKDLGLDSIAITSLVFRLEEVFGIDLSDVDVREVGQMKTVGDAVAASRKIVELANAAKQRVGT